MEPCSSALRSAASRLVFGAGASVIGVTGCKSTARSVPKLEVLTRGASLLLDDLVARVDLRVLRGEVLREALDQVNGAMLAAGAADRDRQVAAVGAAQLGDPVLEEADDVGEHLGDDRVALEVLDDGGIAAG